MNYRVHNYVNHCYEMLFAVRDVICCRCINTSSQKTFLKKTREKLEGTPRLIETLTHKINHLSLVYISLNIRYEVKVEYFNLFLKV